MNAFPFDLSVSHLERCLAETGSSIATRFFAEGSACMDQVSQCLECRSFARLFEKLKNVFPVYFGRVAFGALP